MLQPVGAIVPRATERLTVVVSHLNLLSIFVNLSSVPVFYRFSTDEAFAPI